MFRLKPSIFHDKEEKEEKEAASNEIFELSEWVSFLARQKTQNPLDFHLRKDQKIWKEKKLRKHLRVAQKIAEE